MERGNGNDFAQHIGSNGTGYQNHYSGQRHQIFSGSGTIHNYNAAYANIDNPRERIMQALYTSPYQQRKNRNPDRVPGTCEWFMHHHNFHRWQDSISSSMLWVSANPGCGKSVLAKYLVDKLKTTELKATCYFFFKDDFEDQKSAKAALSCILHQLFIQRENLLSAEIVKRFMSYKAPRANSYYELWELWETLTMIAREENAGEIICILDAFDECIIQERQELAKILREFYGPNDGDVEVEKIAEEISLYIKDRVFRIRANLGLTPKEEELLLQGLAAIRNQTYLWVYLTLEWIETEISNKISEAEIRNAISILPRTVDEAYDKILAKSTDLEETKKLLHIVVAAERPLTLAEMDLALAISQHHKSYKDLALRPTDRVSKYIRDLCGLFINITDEKIYLLHQTAKEFLVPNKNVGSQEYGLAHQGDGLRKSRRSGLIWKSSLKPTESHRILCKICIWLVLFTEFETRSPTEPADVANYLRRHLFLEYSARNWATHFQASNIKEYEILEQLQRLCSVTETRFPTWFKIYWIGKHTSFTSKFTELMIASYFGLEMIVRPKLESEDVKIDAVDGSYHRTALSFASENGFDGVVQLLIKGPNSFGKRFFKKAVLSPFFKGPKVNKIDRHGRTALFYAAWNGHWAVVRRLVKAKARVDMVDEIKGTPISYALCYGHENIAHELMKGAKIHSLDEIRRELFVHAVMLNHEPVVKRLLDSGLDTEVTDEENASVIVLATRWGNTNIVHLLLERGADVNTSDRDGCTPLFYAIRIADTRMIEMVLKAGAKLDYILKTPLLFAIAERKVQAVDLLLRYGADPHFTGDYMVTPLAEARRSGNDEIIQMLEDAVRP
ncbi:ankyrin repeat-containing domain protein [Trichoderma afarasin]